MKRDGRRVQTDREGGAVYADIVVLAEGVNGLVGQRSGLRPELRPDTVALAVKEMHFLPPKSSNLVPISRAMKAW